MGSEAKTRPKTNLVHSKLSKTTGRNRFQYSEYHVLQQNHQTSALANMTVSDSVSSSPKGAGAEPACPPPSKSVTDNPHPKPNLAQSIPPTTLNLSTYYLTPPTARRMFVKDVPSYSTRCTDFYVTLCLNKIIKKSLPPNVRFYGIIAQNFISAGFGYGSGPDPVTETYSASQTPSARFCRHTSKGSREGRGQEAKERERRNEWRGEKKVITRIRYVRTCQHW